MSSTENEVDQMAVQARQYLMYIFRDSPVLLDLLNKIDFPTVYDSHYYDTVRLAIMSADTSSEDASIDVTAIVSELNLLKSISDAHKSYPENPNAAKYIGILGMPKIYSNYLFRDLGLYYPIDTPSEQLNLYNREMLEYLQAVRSDVDRYRRHLNLLSRRYIEEHKYSGDLKRVLLDDYVHSYSYENMKRIEDCFTVMSMIGSCLGNSNSLVPHNVMLTGTLLAKEEGLNSSIYLMKYNDKIPVVMKSITRDITKLYRVVSPLDILHEYLVGTKVNELRSEIANFVYTYGYSQVNNPVRIIDDIVDFFGLFNSDITTQIYLQYIDDAVPFYEIVETNILQIVGKKSEVLTVETGLLDVLNLQILCALMYAYQKIRFKHNDLNGGNILVVALDRIMAVPIKVPVQYDYSTGEITFITKYIYTDHLVVIIDFGRASVKHEYNGDMPLLPLFKLYDSYEGAGIERDVFFHLMQVMDLIAYFEDRTNADYIYTKSNVLSLMYETITGQPLATYSSTLYKRTHDTVRNISEYQQTTYPTNQYYLVPALINYCSRFSEYLHDTVGKYDSVLDNMSTTKNSKLTIRTVPEYYMYRYIPDDSAEVDTVAVLSNKDYLARLANVQYSSSISVDTLWTMQTYKHSNFMMTTLGQMPNYGPLYGDIRQPEDLLPVQEYVAPANSLVNLIVRSRDLLDM